MRKLLVVLPWALIATACVPAAYLGQQMPFGYPAAGASYGPAVRIQEAAPPVGRWDNVMMLAVATPVQVLRMDGGIATGRVVAADNSTLRLQVASGEVELAAAEVMRVDRLEGAGSVVRDGAKGAAVGAGPSACSASWPGGCRRRDCSPRRIPAPTPTPNWAFRPVARRRFTWPSRWRRAWFLRHNGGRRECPADDDLTPPEASGDGCLAATATIAGGCSSPPTQPTVNYGQGVTLYPDSLFRGDRVTLGGDVSDLSKLGGPCQKSEDESSSYDDCVSSLHVPAGWMETVFRDRGFGEARRPTPPTSTISTP